ncbi:MAG: FtsH protease activity modulator HflK [Proteobacteria bacterium]|nr:FtsH protease activity modulator HflK [Pseudomonadota bacterium]MBU1715431.1 FtsH protease activity modulator HflK [Pseudomonadota bacterium]
MAWDDQQPQWGKNKGPTSPEDLIAILIKKLKDAFEGPKNPGGSGGDGSGSPGSGGSGGVWGGIGKVALVIIVIMLFSVASSAYFTIRPGEQGVVLRFGEFSRLADPGLNFKIPLVDDVIKVDVKNVRKEDFGFRTTKAAQRSQFAKSGFEDESLMLTADRNVIDVEWIVQYKIKDPVDYLFKVGDVRQAVRDVSEMTMRRIVGNLDFDYVLSNREILADTTARELQATLDHYESGVDIVKVQLQDVNPPETVKPAFNEVNEADQDMKRLVNEAEETYNREVPKARGTAKRVLEEAHGYAVERVNKAKGDTSQFLAILKEYKLAKEVTRKRMYLETMQQVLPSVEEIYVIDKEQRSLLPLLNVGEARNK